MGGGGDPVADKKSLAASQTVADLVDHYIKRHASTKRSATRSLAAFGRMFQDVAITKNYPVRAVLREEGSDTEISLAENDRREAAPSGVGPHLKESQSGQCQFLRCGTNVLVPIVSRTTSGGPFMDYDLGYFDDDICRLEPLQNLFGPKVLPMSPV